MNKNNIEKIMHILAKHYNYSDKTTLNRMRKKRNHATFVRGNEKKSPFSVSRKEREENQGVSSHAFKILISCLLSLRTQDKNTEKVSKQLFQVAQTPQQISALSLQQLEKIIFSSGHYKKKAKTLKHVSKEIIEKFNSQVPNNKEQLLSIKGIGPKTANIVLAFAYHQEVIPVDTHLHRIPNRLGWVKTKKPEQTEKELMKIIPRKYIPETNGIFILFGKEICQPISPKCSICPINNYCQKIGVTKSR